MQLFITMLNPENLSKRRIRAKPSPNLLEDYLMTSKPKYSISLASNSFRNVKMIRQRINFPLTILSDAARIIIPEQY
ncbi:hypothetical protein HZS_1937 [Henneguya salminicola]|nr:hypothetical protein HZS_1937 [Henneguya salminicola]